MGFESPNAPANKPPEELSGESKETDYKKLAERLAPTELQTDFSTESPKHPDAKILALLGSLAAFSPVHAEEQSSTRYESLPTEKQEQIVQNVFGEETVHTLEDSGFTYEVKLEADPSGKYTIIIGQLHTATKAGLTRGIMKSPVAAYQQGLYEQLPHIASACDGKVFLEGMGNQSSLQEQRDLVEQLGEDLENAAQQDISNVQMAQTALELLQYYYEVKNNRFVRNANIHEGAVGLKENLEQFWESYTPDPESEIDEAYKELHMVSLGMLSDLSAATDTIGGYSTNDDAAIRLFYERKVDLLPTETVEANKAAVDVFNEMQDVKLEYNEYRRKHGSPLYAEIRSDTELAELNKKNDLGTLTEVERARLEEKRTYYSTTHDEIESMVQQSEIGQRYEELQKRFQKAVHDDREDVALELMREHSRDSHACIVYGKAHEWTRAQIKYNQQEEDVGFPSRGLIRLDFQANGGQSNQEAE